METPEYKAGEGLSDEEIALQVQEGDDELYSVLMARYQEKLTRYTQRFVSRDEAHDIVQDALIKAHRKIATFDAQRRFSPWIYRITRNTALTHVDRPHTRDTVILDPESEQTLATDEQSALEQWLEGELRTHVHEAIRSLPDAYAEVIYLRYIDDLSYQEISDIIDKPVSTVGTLIRRAKKKMLTILLDEDTHSL